MNANRRSRPRGVSLIESLVAMVVMALGMLAIAGIQATMRQNADVARQRNEANRLAQAEMETLRSFITIDRVDANPAYVDISTRDPMDVVVPEANATFTLTRNVQVSADPGYRTLQVTVNWTDRAGQTQFVVLNSVIAAAEPKLSGMLSVAPAATAIDRPVGRHRSIPPAARDFGDGRSGFVPARGATVAWVFNNTTGVISSVCTVLAGTSNASLTTASLTSCVDTSAQLLSGYVRFNLYNGPNALTAADAEGAQDPPLNLNVRLDLASSGHSGSPQCFDDAPSSSATASSMIDVAYYCIVYPNASHTWSGRSTLRPRDFNDIEFSWNVDSEGTHRVCRYTTAASDTTTNADHPKDYATVQGNLINQNFLVIRSSKACPSDVAANPASGDLVNSNTRQHQPD